MKDAFTLSAIITGQNLTLFVHGITLWGVSLEFGSWMNIYLSKLCSLIYSEIKAKKQCNFSINRMNGMDYSGWNKWDRHWMEWNLLDGVDEQKQYGRTRLSHMTHLTVVNMYLATEM